MIGPYVSERAWGTVREDYSADGKAWGYFPYEHARSRAYRWNEDGLAGLSDRSQRLCFALTFWNGRDPFLKERIFGLSGPEGNHGEDAKEYWWYSDATPTGSWLRWRYHYPQAEFPYALLRQENARRNKEEPEFELVDTGVFEKDRYWQITADYAKASPDDICIRISVRNAGPDPAEIHVLPTLWFRNRWSWEAGHRAAGRSGDRRGSRRYDQRDRGRTVARPRGDSRLARIRRASRRRCCSVKTKPMFGTSMATRPSRRPTPRTVSTTTSSRGLRRSIRRGTAPRWRAGIASRSRQVGPSNSGFASGATTPEAKPDLGAGFEQIHAVRSREADEYYATLTPDGASDDEAVMMRQAFAGMIWSQQFYHYDVARWLDGDTVPPATARKSGRNADWRHLSNHDIIAMPDKWEYPWYASWDLAFHCIVLGLHRSLGMRSINCCCWRASGTCTRTANCRRTNGISATSTRRCRRGLRLRCSGSTAAPISTSWRGPSTSC